MDDVDEIPVAPRLKALSTRMMGRVAVLAGRFTVIALANSGANRHQYAVLATLDAFGCLSQAELCRRTGIDRSDMNAALNALEKKAMVTRTIDPNIRRQNIVAMSSDGRAYFKMLDERVEAAQSAAMAPLSPVEHAQLNRLLAKLYEYHSREAPR